MISEALKMIKKSDYFIFGAALIAFAASVYLWFTGQKGEGVLVGVWVPSILSFGIYMRILMQGR